MKSKGLTTTQLKLIAIMAMVVDHVVWGFVDLFSVTGQIMHTIGRLTIPIMCFFIAEGYRKTTNLKSYLSRIASFAMISIIPFYLFFGEEYGYRQNFIFDLFLALLVLVIADSKKLSKPMKIVLGTTVTIISAVVGGWPVFPILLVLIFFYGKSFKQKCLLVSGTVLLVEGTTIVAILLNNQYHFMGYDWVWYQWLYFLGFILPLPLLAKYNGIKGKYPISRSFFFLFYPAHFVVLYEIKMLVLGELQVAYITMNVAALIIAIYILFRLISKRPSKPLIICILLCISAIMYIFGFVLEVSSASVDFVHAAVALEYFGECFVFIFFLFFICAFCQIKVPNFVSAALVLFSTVIVWLVITASSNGIFYKHIGMDYSGPFHKIDLTYGPGFYIFIAYMILVCGGSFIITLINIKKRQGIERKRLLMVMFAILCPWLAFLALGTGITNGYEVSAIGMVGAIGFICRALFSYGYFDSMQLAVDNALHRIGDGILVVDLSEKVVYSNDSMNVLFPGIRLERTAELVPELIPYLAKESNQYVANGRTFDVIYEDLIERDTVQGHMLTFKDMTEHYQHLAEAERFAHTDVLTGLYNRSFFSELVAKHFDSSKAGTLLMFDIDNFKMVNDRFGHGVGDDILKLLAKTITREADGIHLGCRVGGDEFMLFLKDVTSNNDISAICQSLIDNFAAGLNTEHPEVTTSISIGAYTTVLGDKTATSATTGGAIPGSELFTNAYKKADEVLYTAKHAGKATFRIYE
ncbi:MAG: diguanylate cyclase [Lachnospiraceae bacterium]|nr:diguanylate cyclase [Lachnospiraceae bacterium]